MHVVFCKIDHCIHIHWCIVVGLGHNDPWVESHMWPQQTWGQRSSRGQWPLVQVFGKKGQCIHILWCIFKSNITMIAKVCDRESRRDTWFENRLVSFWCLWKEPFDLGWSASLLTGNWRLPFRWWWLLPLFTQRYKAWSFTQKSWMMLFCSSSSMIMKRLPSAASTNPSISFFKCSAILWFSAARFLARCVEPPYNGFGSCCKTLKVGGVKPVLRASAMASWFLITCAWHLTREWMLFQVFGDEMKTFIRYHQIARCWFREATKSRDVVFTFAGRCLDFLRRAKLLRFYCRLRLEWGWLRRIGCLLFFFLLIFFAGWCYLFRLLEFSKVTWSFGHGVERAFFLKRMCAVPEFLVLWQTDDQPYTSRFLLTAYHRSYVAATYYTV